MSSRLRDLVRELRSRSVIRAMIAYAVAAWMLLQVADVTFDRLPIPDNSMTILITLVIIGFPVTFILAWAYEITTRGIVRHENASGGAPKLRFVPFMVLVATLTVGTGSLLYYLSQNFWESPRRSIAVLPFTNNSAEQDTEYFSDGLTEEIQSLIVRLNEFRVVALSTSYALKDSVMDVVSIADRLGAEVVLQGSVRRFHDRVSVTARLIDGDDGVELWSDSYDEELSDVFTIQEEIARQVARALHVVLPVSSKRRLKNLGSSNVEAYDLYLRGIDFLRKPADETNILLADGFLRQSLALDPDFANAHAAVCETHLARYRLSRDASRFGDAEAACRKALELGSDSSDTRLALGGLYLASGKYENALHEFSEALETNSNSADALIGLAGTQIQQGQNDAAEASLRQAISVDVSYWASFNAMGNFLFDQGRFDEAAEFYQMFVSRADDDAQALNNLGAAYYLAGEFSKAATAWDSSLQIKPTRSAYSNTGSMYFYLGDFDQAADRYARAVNMAPMDYRLWGNLADAYYYAKDKKPVADVAYRRAIEFGEQQLAVNANDMDTMSDVAYYYSRIGEEEKALELSATARDTMPDNMYAHYNSALIYSYFGDIDSALSALERAVELDYQRDLLEMDPGLERLQKQERFRRLVSTGN